MSKAGISFEEMKIDMFKDEEFKIEYEKLKPRYESIEQIIRARKEQNITQAELAKRVGTQNCTVLNDTLAWDIDRNRDNTTCLDIDPGTLYELPAVEEMIA